MFELALGPTGRVAPALVNRLLAASSSLDSDWGHIVQHLLVQHDCFLPQPLCSYLTRLKLTMYCTNNVVQALTEKGLIFGSRDKNVFECQRVSMFSPKELTTPKIKM